MTVRLGEGGARLARVVEALLLDVATREPRVLGRLLATAVLAGEEPAGEREVRQ